MNYESAWNNQREVARKLEQRVKELESLARDVVEMECSRVNADGGIPYDPIANPGQFDDRIVRLAQAVEFSSPWPSEWINSPANQVNDDIAENCWSISVTWY